MVKEEEATIKNWQSYDTGSDGSYHSLEDELNHLLEKREVRKGSDDRGPDYIPEQQGVW
jgi:hypothetical protein